MTTATSQQIEQLAAAIGNEVYIDVEKWHLYLKDAKLHTDLAERLAPIILDQAVSEAAVTEVLQQIPIKLGGGRTQLSLSDVLPMQSLLNLLDVLEEFSRSWT